MGVKQSRGKLISTIGLPAPKGYSIHPEQTIIGMSDCFVTEQTVVIGATSEPLVYSRASGDIIIGNTHSTEKGGQRDVAAVY